MRTSIIGAGALGGYFGGAWLARDRMLRLSWKSLPGAPQSGFAHNRFQIVGPQGNFNVATTIFHRGIDSHFDLVLVPREILFARCGSHR